MYNQILENLLEYGVVTISEFWDMTMAEISLLLKTTQNRLNSERVNKLQFNYELAKNIATFTGLVINGSGNKIPTFETLYPQAKSSTTEEEQKAEVNFYRDQLRLFAKEHNKRRAKKLEQEANNG